MAHATRTARRLHCSDDARGLRFGKSTRIIPQRTRDSVSVNCQVQLTSVNRTELDLRFRSVQQENCDLLDYKFVEYE